MKNNKGFTLIELLAIIVILAIIAVITVPIILNIIENAKKGTAQDSAYGYKDAVNKLYITKLSTDPNYNIPDGTYSISDLEVAVSGKQPSANSWVTIENNNVTTGCLQFDEYKVKINNGKVENAEKGECEAFLEAKFVLIDDTNEDEDITIGDEYIFKTEHFYVISTNEETTLLINKYNLNIASSLQDENSASKLYHSECAESISKYNEKLVEIGLENATVRMPKVQDISGIISDSEIPNYIKDRSIFNTTYWLEESCCGPNAYMCIMKNDINRTYSGTSDNNSSQGVKAVIEVPTILLPTETDEEEEILPCPGPNCVYAYYNEQKKYGANGDILNQNEYKTDYTELNKNFFLGHILDNNGRIIRIFACAIKDGTPFCLEGTTDGSKYKNNKKVLKKVFDGYPINTNLEADGCYFDQKNSGRTNSRCYYNYIDYYHRDDAYIYTDGDVGTGKYGVGCSVSRTSLAGCSN